MESIPSVTAVPPEPRVPLTFPYQPPPPGVAIDPAAPPSNAEVTHAAEFMGAGMNAEDAAQWIRHPFWARGRFPHGGWYGMRWGVGYGGDIPQQSYLADTSAIHGHGSDIQHGKSAIVESYKPVVVPKINFSTTGEEPASELPASKPSLPPQPSLLPLSWCDICRVDCNSLKVLEKHKTGKRHTRTLKLLQKLNGQPETVEDLAPNYHLKPEPHSESVSVLIEDDTKVEVPIDTTSNLKKKRKRNAVAEQPRVCVLCNAACNSEAMFESHLAGKKHLSRINHFQRPPNTVYGLMSGYVPSDQSPTSASHDTQTLYYGFMGCGQPQAYDVLNPRLDYGSQYDFIES